MSQLRIDLGQWMQDNPASLSAAGQSAGSLLQFAIHPDELSTDSRQISPGSVFLPLSGEHFDGHSFLAQVFEQGARLAFCSQAYYAAHAAELTGLPLLLVPDTLSAYQSLARKWRRQLRIPVIAITGSSGKTSSKEILYQLLSPNLNLHRSQANYNNEIGVPKTLLELRPEHALCIVEMGMRGPGQIAELCAIAEPEYGLITNVGPVHLSELGTMEHIARAKWELADWLAQHQGLLVINHENSWLAELSETYPGRLLRCGKDPVNDLQLLNSEAESQGQRISYRIGEQPEKMIWLDLEGEHQALNLLCGLGMMYALRQNLGQDLSPPQRISVPRLFGRQQRLECAGLVLINDAYNANPDSMKAALQVLAQQPGRRIAVLGKMAELGPQAEVYHRDLGLICEDLDLDAVYVVGAEARPLLNSLSQVPGHYFAQKQDLTAALLAALQPGDTVLFKASRSACLEEVVSPVTQHFANLAD
ncbi:MAG: UDP-N-acetylmuramoyl-tripeptide--D-alanyl-D-alanine ligase [Candidatus Melainabacteria bacterium HGW-Melainabacteria-1]|nr:MAG: UDP-N-acetylmuramoyl-tripeptide--D-alanyl-D-alanine ligase [Candidatus Melainabacteria bacterium HGW-Melainabacteria-1]